jgi:hypothetical protein
MATITKIELLELLGLAQVIESNNNQLRVLARQMGPNKSSRILSLAHDNDVCIRVIKTQLMTELEKK